MTKNDYLIYGTSLIRSKEILQNYWLLKRSIQKTIDDRERVLIYLNKFPKSIIHKLNN